MVLVPDPGLETRRGGGHPDPEIRGGGGREPGLQNFFRPFGLRFGLKIRGEPAPPGPSPGSATRSGYEE